MSRRPYSKRVCVSLALLAVILAVIAVTSLVLALTSDKVFTTLLYKQLIFIPGTRIYDVWASPTQLGYISIYLFNVTNSNAVEHGQKPHVVEVGPFVYEVLSEKRNIHFSEEDPPRIAHFTSVRKYIYQLDRSIKLDLNTKLILPNLEHLVAHSNVLYRFLKYFSTNPKPVFTECAISDVLWGCPKGLFDTCTCDWGLLDAKPTTASIDTGAYDLLNADEVVEFDGNRYHPVYEQDEANIIRGSEGIRFRPSMEVGFNVWFYIPPICRALKFTATAPKPSEHRPDLELLELRLQSIKTDPAVSLEERIYCDSEGECPPRGMINLGPCFKHKSQEVPLYLSKPYFMDTDPRVVDRVDGLAQPNEKNHSTSFAVEPFTGISLEAHQRFQINAFMSNTQQILENHAKPIYQPIIWFSHDILVPKPFVDEVKDNVLSWRERIHLVSTVLCVITSLLAFVITVHLVVRQHCVPREKWVRQCSATQSILVNEEN